MTEPHLLRYCFVEGGGGEEGGLLLVASEAHKYTENGCAPWTITGVPALFLCLSNENHL